MGIQKKEEEDTCGGKPVGEDGKVDYKYALFMYCVSTESWNVSYGSKFYLCFFCNIELSRNLQNT